MDAEVGYSFLVYEVTIVDLDGNVLISSPSLPDRKIQHRRKDLFCRLPDKRANFRECQRRISHSCNLIGLFQESL